MTRKHPRFFDAVHFRYKSQAMISVTSKSRYAVVAMAELARSGERPVPIAQIAERRAMPVQFLEQLFTTLRATVPAEPSWCQGRVHARAAGGGDHRARGGAVPGRSCVGLRGQGGRRDPGRRGWRRFATSSVPRQSPTSPAARPKRPTPACTTSEPRADPPIGVPWLAVLVDDPGRRPAYRVAPRASQVIENSGLYSGKLPMLLELAAELRHDHFDVVARHEPRHGADRVGALHCAACFFPREKYASPVLPQLDGGSPRP